MNSVLSQPEEKPKPSHIAVKLNKPPEDDAQAV